jgi:pyridinium-3,5-biscarboxylic acid mononucleotide synthase
VPNPPPSDRDVIPDRALALLRQVADGVVRPEQALAALVEEPGGEALDFATIDHHRALRHGYPEVIFAQGKTAEQVVSIADRLAAVGDGFLATRTDASHQEALRRRFERVDINPVARTAYLAGDAPLPARAGEIMIVTAGTSDGVVAEEAAVTARALGHRVARAADVGVAGLHRIFAHRTALAAASVVIVVAGMDGALPSVVGGLVGVPVIAVPTSVGYGASFGGVAALLAMLNSCASGVTVVNIDNGFGAAMAAGRILRARESGGAG